MNHPTIGIVVFPNAEELDFVGPWEVFTGAQQLALPNFDPAAESPELNVHLIAETTEPVRCAKRMRVLPDFSFENAPELDVILVPGGMGTRTEIANPVMLEWLATAAASCQWITSVCTGSLLLAGAGLTREKNITTHWAFVKPLQELAPESTVLDNVRYVRDGNVVTAAGVSAGIDMALWLTGQIWDVAHARTTQRFMEYDPAPPYTADA